MKLKMMLAATFAAMLFYSEGIVDAQSSIKAQTIVKGLQGIKPPKGATDLLFPKATGCAGLGETQRDGFLYRECIPPKRTCPGVERQIRNDFTQESSPEFTGPPEAADRKRERLDRAMRDSKGRCMNEPCRIDGK